MLSLIHELNDVMSQISDMLPRLQGFITEFNKVIITNDINVITDGSGNFSADVLGVMPQAGADLAIRRIGVIDGLINHHKTTITDLFAQGTALDNQIKVINPNYVSPILEKLDEFNRIKNTYRH